MANRALLVALVLATASCAGNGAGFAVADAQSKTPIIPEALKSTYETFKYAPAMRAGDFVFLSGVVAKRRDSEASDAPAIERAFDEIELVLGEAGASWNDVVDVTSYLTDFDSQIGPLWAVKDKRVPAPYPAWTAIGIDRLYGGESAIIEIKITAYVPLSLNKP